MSDFARDLAALFSGEAEAAPPATNDNKNSLGPVVYRGQLRYVSPSQVDRFDPKVFGGCERKWWFRYVAREKEEEKQAQKTGTIVHSQIEHYLKTGQDVLGDVARAGKRFIPAPLTERPGIEVELGFGEVRELLPAGIYGPLDSPVRAAGVPFVLRIDLFNERGEWIDDDGVVRLEPDTLEIADWKTSSQARDKVEGDRVVRKSFAKRGADLLTWPMVIYGKAGLVLRPHFKRVRLSHGYFQTKGPRDAVKHSHAVPAEEIETRFERAHDIVRRMIQVASEDNIEAVQANYDSCTAYGGCSYRAKCPRDPMRVLTDLFGGKAMSLQDRLKSMKKETAAPAAAPPATDAPSPEVAAEIEKLKAEEQGASIAPPDQPEPEKTHEPIPEGTVVPEVVSNAQTSPAAGACLVAGSERELTIDEVAEKKMRCPGCGEELKVKKPTKRTDGKYVATVPEHKTKPAERPQVVEQPHTIRDEHGVRDEVVVVTDKPEAEVKEAEVIVTKSLPTSAIFYLDCAPDDGSLRTLTSYLAPLCRVLEEQCKAADLRCAPADSELGFGKWKGALAAVVRANPPPPGEYTVDSDDEVEMVAFHALKGTQARIIRGRK